MKVVRVLIAAVLVTVAWAVPALAASSTLSLDKGSYVQGQTIIASYSTTQVSSTNWVGLYKAGQTPGSVASTMWKYAPNASGSVSFATDSLAPGSYAAYYLYNDGYTILAGPQALTVTAPSTGTNLLVNGDAEAGDPSISGYDGVTLPGWQVTGVPTAVSYSAGQGFPGASTPGPADRGGAFFAGGPVGSSTLTQTVDVSAGAAQIDAGGATYTLSGWLGGYSSEISTATVKITFRNGAGGALGTGQIGPVTAADRGNATKLLQRTASAPIPAQTRSITALVQLTGDPARDSANRYNDAYADSLSLSVSAPVSPAPLAVPPSAVPAFDHVFFVMLENRSYDQVIGNSAAPYLTGLAGSGVKLAQSYGAVHPSDPNYMAVAGGSTFGYVSNPFPADIGKIDAPHIGDRAEAAGKTWRAYVEDMGTPCNATKNGDYDPDNVPFWFFKNMTPVGSARCLDKLQPITRLWSDLASAATTPNFVWFEPNSCHSMHNCSTTVGDTWFHDNLPRILTSPAWTQQRSLLVITFDEDDNVHGQRIPTIVLGSPGTTKTGYQSNIHYTHYSVLRTIESALGLATLTKNDKYAVPLNDLWP
ncbi:alkaline phosphatase family protein [Nonomuraea sp. NPDC050536]|uniref:alkaline phosphatase family protein n=1 Tax=Nonomuraea sp. NPDC050536 TaxID=3364366 RepID=UPI0037C80FEF